MFTGIIEFMGTVASAQERGTARVLRVDAPALASSLSVGDSVAVSGVCLTVERADATGFEATAVSETLVRTTLGEIEIGDPVNLECAAGVDRLFGGHLVQGHIDGVGVVRSFEGADEGDRVLEVEVPEDIHDLCVDKGSIAIDGVSLTIAKKLERGRIAIAIVPHTFTHTVVAGYRPGRRVNVEADVVARYVREYVRRYQTAGPR
jgi:riboflavin synthase